VRLEERDAAVRQRIGSRPAPSAHSSGQQGPDGAPPDASVRQAGEGKEPTADAIIEASFRAYLAGREDGQRVE
jgi:hypothetical protein